MGLAVKIIWYLQKWKPEENFNFNNASKNWVKSKLVPDVTEEKCFIWSNKKSIFIFFGHCETLMNVETLE